ncbi:MAG: hypothetical protein BZ151_10245 [Desulfobacca sp. 4484_104]|nr:MAG: hypothetical protein BZ151_10245 [Desulfobacca sp. 4484_104]
MSKLRKALEKAKEAREQLQADAAAPAEEIIPATKLTAPAGKTTTGTTTRVVTCNPALMRRHKIIFDCQTTTTSDQIKILRTRLLQRLVEMGGNSLLITSPSAGAGTTLTAINLAFSVAQEIERTVLLVDANLRKPSIHTYFGINPEKGLADYLLGNADIPELLFNPGFDKITVLPGGKPLTNSTELLGAPQMETLVNEVKSRYADRFIIFDSSPVLNTADPLVFANHIDGILLVVEAETTLKKEVKQAMELLAGKPVLGTVLNKVK